jgi:SNF family Na+-dependent transporter
VGLAAGLLLAWLASPRLGLVVASIASLISLAAWISPRGAYARIERAFEALGRGIGSAMSWILMPILFVMIFLPFGVLTRRGSKDPLKRFFEASASSYWKVRDPEREAERSYQRPF